MNIFIINLCLIALEGFWFLSNKNIDKGEKKFCILASLQWILISGLRGLSVGADTKSYYDNFKRIKTYSWNYVLDFAQNRIIVDSDAKAPGYTLLVKLFQVFSDNYQVFLIFVAILFFSWMGYSIYKNSENPVLSYILFSCLFYSFFAITGIRQTIATSFVVFLGIELIKKRKLIAFIICILLMYPIHSSAICFLPFYWIANIKITGKRIGIYWTLVAMTYIFRERFMAALQFLVGYENYVQTEGAGIGTFIYLLMLIAAVVTIFYKRIVKEENDVDEIAVSNKGQKDIPINRLAVNALFMSCIFSSLLLINQNTMRVVQYYSLGLLYLLPQIANVFKVESKAVFNVIVFTVAIALVIYSGYTYVFFWQ